MSEREDDAEELTSEVVFARLERLRELLKLTDYLKGFRPGAGDDVAPAEGDG